ncbi:MAG: DNA polymerase/3'-5' exonuclease PolX [Candidatus Omnitrophica bacterium]|nr:DNA polymerase/3'-5' exonuclease PolX [Candidatus Omnitrophota bacterium]
MKNQEIARIFRDIAAILEVKGDNPFRIRAYERAAQNIEALAGDIEEYIRQGRLKSIPGIGEDLANKIREVAVTGRLEFYEELKKSIPQGVLELLNIPSVGPKTARLLYEKLKIKSISSLEQAIRRNKLAALAGIKEKTIENIRKGIEILKKGRERMTLGQAELAAVEFLKPLEKLPEVKKLSVAGSLRRQKETVRDIDILAISKKPKKVIEAFVKFPAVRDILAEGQTKASVRTRQDVQIDCRVVEDKSFGAALLYFTGSKRFNIKIRQLAIKKSLKVNEYGVFKGDRYVCGRTEEEVFKLLGMQYIEPELREDSGEVELAKKHALPLLIGLKDIKGDLHVHSTWSDGSNSIEEVARACRARGYSYVAVTDHSQSLRVAGGLTVKELARKKKEIELLNRKLKGIRILFGTEAEIDSGGNIDYRDEVLKEFDVVVAAIHTGFKQSRSQLTKRTVEACKNKYVHIIAHPTGKLWGTREAYDIDLDEVSRAARDTNTALEIDAFPSRLDLNGQNCRRVKELGVKLAVSTDSHTTDQLANMKLGVSMARRGWLTRQDVLNTLPPEAFLKAIKK